MPTPPDIFGEDIAGKINQALGPLVFDQILINITEVRNPLDPTEVTLTETPHDCKGFVDVFEDDHVDGTLVLRTDRKIVILGASLPSGVTPQPGDKITAEGTNFNIVPKGVKRDPAAATYECQSR